MTQAIAQKNQLGLDVSAAQRSASDPKGSVWVAASAGSGKTKVLADRVTRLLLEGTPPERILCLTFTRAAAAEMSIRLTQRLSRWATCEDTMLDYDLDDLQNYAPDQGQRDRARRLFAQVLSCAGGMRIQTIHAFAQEILARFPLEAGLAPHFTVMEESDADSLWREAFDELLERLAEHSDSADARAFAVVIRSLGESSLLSLLREVKAHSTRLSLAIQKAGGFAVLIDALRAQLHLEPDDSELLYRAQAAAEGAFDRAGLLYAARIIKEKGSKTFAPHAEIILAWLAQDEEGRRRDLDQYVRGYLTATGQPYARIVNKDVLAEHPEIEEPIHREALRMLDLQERLQTVLLAEETQAVLTLALALMRGYAAKKTAKAVLDYDDLIARTNALLARPDIAPWVLFKLDGGIDHVLVDESQDTNPDQWRIIACLADEYFVGESARTDRSRTLFVVGDEKQSIYSFLKADPEEFARMRAHFSARINAAENPYAEVPLNVSFRSAPAILRAVDAVFAPDVVRSGVSHEPVAHTAFRTKAAGRVEVWPLFTPPEDQKKAKTRLKTPEDWELPLGYEAAHNPVAELANTLAAQIQNWITAGHMVYDRDLKYERPMHAGDVMVLVQHRKPFVDYFVRALKQKGVPVSGVDRMRLIEQLAVMDLMALLQFALLPEDDLTLATILRGPLIGASEEDLMALAIGRKGSLWDSLREKVGRPFGFAAWHEYLQAIAAQADVISPLALLSRVLNTPCPADKVSGRRAIAGRLGPDAEDPIDELLAEAEAFGLRQSPSLQSFLHWLGGTEFEIKREMEAAAGRVRITTVHTSKGLESPIVILPDTMRVPERRRIDKILWDEENNLPFYVPREPLNDGLRRLRDGAYNKKIEENRRLLYVALTRAADRLYVCGFDKKENNSGDKETSKSEDNISSLQKETWYGLITQGLAPLHQGELVGETGDAVMPSIVLADETSVPKQAGTAVTVPAPEKQDVSTAPPSWLFAPPPPDPSPPRPLVPSRPSEEDPPVLSPQDERFARGRIIHRLLQSLPDLDPTLWDDAVRRFLSGPQQGLKAQVQDEMAREVLGLLRDPRFAPLFGPQSRAEQPIIGLSGERLIAGQVDRLAIVQGEVWIVDYKTNRPPPADTAHIPSVYSGQMEAYRTVLQAIYPASKVRCFLLWTYTLMLMEVGALANR